MAEVAFHRPARDYPERLTKSEISIVAPPLVQPGSSRLNTALQILLPIVMSLSGMAFIFLFHVDLTFIIIFAGIALISAFASVAMRFTGGGTGGRKKKRADRRRYLDYLAQQEVILRKAADSQVQVEDRLYPSPPLLTELVNRQQYLWERRAVDSDFLTVAVGRGDRPLNCPAKLELSDSPFVEYEPELLAAARQLVGMFTTLPKAPVTVPIATLSSVSVVGDRNRTRPLVRAMLTQVAAFQSPSDVRVMGFVPSEVQPEWDWLKWLPHVRPTIGGDRLCMLTDDAGDFASMLESELSPRLEQARKLQPTTGTAPVLSEHPHLIVLVDGFSPRASIAQLPGLTDAIRRGSELRVTVLTLVGLHQDQPSDVDAEIELTFAGLNVELTDAGVAPIRAAAPELTEIGACETMARAMAPLRLEDRRQQQEFSETIRLLDLLAIPSPAAIDPQHTWRPRPRSSLLRTPLGLRGDGEALSLDLKEAAAGGMGPHGLVIGATGSGKSELLRTLVTGLAVNHSPELLSFVFVDYKGGAAFADLAELPHVAGMITNLQSDLTRVDRMHASLLGEQERRMGMLREAGNLDNIREYQKRRDNDPSLAPMPYLMIIVDEFSELLANRPDFLDLFVAIGRVGRSLGMHLLLSSQRLEEGRLRGLEGHLRYRICLRTFSAQESSTVLGTPDAYYLPSFPGVGYFKVDTSIYQRFKTALITGTHDEDGRRAGADTAVRLFAAVPRNASLHGTGKDAATIGNNMPTEMEVVIGRLTQYDRSGAPPVHQIWLPPLAPIVTLDTVLREACAGEGVRLGTPHPFGPLRVPIGMLDRPAAQRQDPLFAEFGGVSGHLALVGAPQTGKSTMLRTLISSFMLTHGPEDVSFYCIDLGGGTLHWLENAPHLGGVCGKLEREKVRRLVREVRSIIEEREVLFRRHGVDSVAGMRQRRDHGELPDVSAADVFLIVDNWAAMRQEFDDLETDIVELVSGGLAYGIHVIITSNRWAEIRTNIRDNIGNRLEFRLNDPIESEMARGAAAGLTAGIAGRGLAPPGLHWQAALPRIDGIADTARLREATGDLVARVTRAWRGRAAARRVRMLPARVAPADLPTPMTQPPGVPLGLEEFRLEPLYVDLFSGDPHFLVLGDAESGKTNLLRAWADGLTTRYPPDRCQLLVVDYRRTLLECSGGPHEFAYACTPAMVQEAVARLRGLIDERLPGANLTRDQLRSRSWWKGPEVVVIIDDYDLVMSPVGNPLQPLVELLPQGRDVGFHVILARRVGGTARSSFEPFYQRLKELGTPGFIMSGDPAEGIILGAQRAAQLPPGRGFLVRRGERTALVQAVFIPDEEAAAAR